MLRISLIGGGRWARTILSVLSGLGTGRFIVTVHTPGNAGMMRAFAVSLGDAIELRVSDKLPAYDDPAAKPDIVIVANKARDHWRHAITAIEAGIATFVEKPMALGADATSRMISSADLHGTLLGASNVFLFARYIDTFADRVTKAAVKRITFHWTDPASEVRGGEIKQYDPALTVFDDVLPHIVPILMRLGLDKPTLTALSVDRGGAAVHIELSSQGTPATVHLERNAQSRRRVLEIVSTDTIEGLDFSNEPGQISAEGRHWSGDPSWGTAPGPIAAMLETFLASVEKGSVDPRLSPLLALASAKLADETRPRYFDAQTAWLTSMRGAAIDNNLRYALTELKQGDACPADETIDEFWRGMRSVHDIRRAADKACTFQAGRC